MLGFRVRVRVVIIIMINTISTATIACVVKRIRKRTTGPEVGSSNPNEYQQQKRVKVTVRLQGRG